MVSKKALSRSSAEMDNSLLEKSRLENYIAGLSDEVLNGEFDKIYENAPIGRDSLCGIGSFRSRFLQRFANKKAFIFVFGVIGLIFASSHAYYNGTITTVEKRFKISSKNMGFIATGNDISSFIVTIFIAYYGGKGHRPRWIALGVLSIVLYCLINSMPHFIYGPGEDSLLLTKEYNGVVTEAQTRQVIEAQSRKMMCQKDDSTAACIEDNSNFFAQFYFFAAQLIAGIGQSLKHTLGISYLDDNIKKSKTPALISFSYFIRLLGPAAGYALASFSLTKYVAPNLTPLINNKDPRWIGAWYMGWIVIASVLLTFGVLCAMFPKELPRAAVRRFIAEEKERRQKKATAEKEGKEQEKDEVNELSFDDFKKSFLRLVGNKVFMLNTFSGVFQVFGFMPFWIYSAKLIETLFRQTSSASSLFTGSFGLVASAIGILSAGYFITKFKPGGRALSRWNVIVGVLSVMCIFSFSFMGCQHSKNAVVIDDATCSSDCHCDLVKYSPVCGADGRTFISACHAGCNDIFMGNKTRSYEQCSCVNAMINNELNKTALPGPCPIDCRKQLYIFLAVICFMKFIGSTGRASNFLVGLRCVEPRDKSLAIGLGMSMVRMFASVPSPILFGFIIDSACIAWGRTCTSKGNCWIYDEDILKTWFFYLSSIFVLIGTFFDYLVYRNAGHLKIFDDDEMKEMREKKAKKKSVEKMKSDESVIVVSYTKNEKQ